MLSDRFLDAGHRAGAFLRNNKGSTAIEYALIASLIGMGLLAGLGSTRDGVAASFNSLMTSVGAVLGNAAP